MKMSKLWKSMISLVLASLTVGMLASAPARADEGDGPPPDVLTVNPDKE
jgi:hypothetical protein